MLPPELFEDAGIFTLPEFPVLDFSDFDSLVLDSLVLDSLEELILRNDLEKDSDNDLYFILLTRFVK